MKIIIVCILFMLLGCNVQPNTTDSTSKINSENIKENLDNTKKETKDDKTIETVEEKKFLKVEEQYYYNGTLDNTLYFEYDNLGRLISEDVYHAHMEYTYIGDSDKVNTRITDDWEICEYKYDNLGRKKSEISTIQEDIYYDKSYKYHGNLLIEEYSYYPYSNINEIITYIYEDGLLKSKNTETILNNTDEYNSYLEVYSYGSDNKLVTTESYYMGNYLTDINRYFYKDNLLIKKENISFDKETGDRYDFSYNEFEYDEFGNMINNKFFYSGELYAETKYIYEEFK